MTVRPWIEGLTDSEREVVQEALRAAVDGPFFPDWEFATLFGSERDEVREVLAGYPHTDDPDRQFVAVNNAMNNLLGYPHTRDNEWTAYLSVDRDHLARILCRIREASGANDETREYLKDEIGRRSALPDGELLQQRATIEALITSANRYRVAVPARLNKIVNAWDRANASE